MLKHYYSNDYIKQVVEIIYKNIIISPKTHLHKIIKFIKHHNLLIQFIETYKITADDINYVKDADSHNLLQAACKHNNETAVHILCRLGGWIDNSFPCYPIFVNVSNKDITTTLIMYGADIHNYRHQGKTFIQHVLNKNAHTTMNYLIKNNYIDENIFTLELETSSLNHMFQHIDEKMIHTLSLIKYESIDFINKMVKYFEERDTKESLIFVVKLYLRMSKIKHCGKRKVNPLYFM